MSRRFSKLEEKPPIINTEVSQPQAVEQTPVIGKMRLYVFLILGSVIALTAVFFLGNLSSNIVTIKNSIFSSMDERIQRQQIQIILLTKKLNALQSFIDDRNQKDEAVIKNINNSLENKLDGLNNSVKSKLDQSSINMDHREAILQANIDKLNNKFNKLQKSIPAVLLTGDQT